MSGFELCLENTCRYVSVIKSLFAGLKQKYKIFTLTCDKFPWNETKIQMTKWLYHLSSARTSVFLAVSSRMECVLTVCYRCLCCSRSRSLRRLYSSNTLWWSGPCSSEVTKSNSTDHEWGILWKWSEIFYITCKDCVWWLSLSPLLTLILRHLFPSSIDK